jgi:hypothetical protein
VFLAGRKSEKSDEVEFDIIKKLGIIICIMSHEQIFQQLEGVPTEPVSIRAPRRESLNIIDRQRGIVIVRHVLEKLQQMYPALFIAAEQAERNRPALYLPYDTSKGISSFDTEASALIEEEPVTANALLALQLCLKRLQAPQCSYLDIADAYNAALYFLDLETRNVDVVHDLRDSAVYSAMPAYKETEQTVGDDALERIQKAARSMIRRCQTVLNSEHIRRYLYLRKGDQLLSMIRRSTEELHALCYPWLHNLSVAARCEVLEAVTGNAQKRSDGSRITVQSNNDDESEMLGAFRFEERELVALDSIFSIDSTNQ